MNKKEIFEKFNFYEKQAKPWEFAESVPKVKSVFTLADVLLTTSQDQHSFISLYFIYIRLNRILHGDLMEITYCVPLIIVSSVYSYLLSVYNIWITYICFNAIKIGSMCIRICHRHFVLFVLRIDPIFRQSWLIVSVKFITI